MGVPLYRWMVYFMENPIKHGWWLGVPPLMEIPNKTLKDHSWWSWTLVDIAVDIFQAVAAEFCCHLEPRLVIIGIVILFLAWQLHAIAMNTTVFRTIRLNHVTIFWGFLSHGATPKFAGWVISGEKTIVRNGWFNMIGVFPISGNHIISPNHHITISWFPISNFKISYYHHDLWKNSHITISPYHQVYQQLDLHLAVPSSPVGDFDDWQII